mgnify:CR=1 FL=1
MKFFRSVYSISLQNFRKWKYDSRILITIFFLLIFIHSYTKGLSSFCDYVNVKSSPWIYPFLYMQYYNKLLFFFPLLLIFSNAPFIDSNQLYIIARSGRIKWCMGQICYIFITSSIYFVFIILFSILLNIKCIEFTNDWGKVINTLANTNAGTEFQIGFSPDRNIVNMFSPLQAVWFTFLHSWVSGVVLGLIIFLFNMIFKGVGTFISSFILVFSAIASKQISLVKFSPVTWSTLNYIHIIKNDGLPNYRYITVGYIGISFVLLILILFVSKKYNYDKDFKK